MFLSNIVYKSVHILAEDKLKKWVVDLFLMILSMIASIALNNAKNGFLIQYGYPFGLNIALMGTSFICAGALFKRVFEKRIFEKGKYIWIVAAIFFFLSVGLYRFNLPCSVTEGFPHVEMSIGSYGNIGMFYLVAICGSGFIICVSKIIKQSVIIEHIGRNTIAILGTHGLVISMFLSIPAKFVESDILMSFVVFVSTLILELLLCAAINRFIPNLNGK